MKVGGRDFNESKRNVELAMRGEDSESLQKYAVEVNGIDYPPKQVLATVTGWERTSFTTMEAQRVLKKLGFESFDISVIQSGRRTFAPAPDDIEPQSSINQRISALEAGLVTAQEAIASLAARVRKFEGSA